jgi:hypothetical protein
MVARLYHFAQPLTRGPATTENRLMSRAPSIRWRHGALGLALLALPATAAAQISPTTPAHPSMPWSGITTPQGQLIRFIYVPAQAVTLEYLVPGVPESAPPALEPAPPGTEGEGKGEAKDEAKGEVKGEVKTPQEAPPRESAPAAPQILRQQVTVPGYYVRESTVGFHYPERWAIEQAEPNVYRWRQIPAQFVPK